MTSSSAPLKTELRVLTALSAPVSATQLGSMLMGVVDTIMIARVGVAELAAVGLANVWAWGWLSVGQGVVQGADPIISQAHGAGDREGVALGLQRGIVVGVLASLPLMLAWGAIGPGLRLLGQEPEVADLAQAYMWMRLPSLAPFLVYVALRQYLACRTLNRPAMWVMVIANVLNVLFNWVFIFGHLGVPPLGIAGAGIATGLTSTMLPILLFAWTWGFGLHQGASRRWDARSFAPKGLAQVVRLGLPVGLQMSLEAWAFSFATIMVGWIGVQALAAHQILLNLAATTFMVPLGISIGASARVGNLIGAGDGEQARLACWAAIGIGAFTMACFAVLFVLLRHVLPRVYLDDPAVLAIAATLLPIGAAFQIADGVQVVAGGLLRGMGRANAAAIVNLLGYFTFALPLAWLFGFHLEAGVHGVWWGMALGLAAVAVGMVLWVRRMAWRPIDELRVRVS